MINKLPLPVLLVIFAFLYISSIGFINHLLIDISIIDILGISAFLFIAISTAQDDIIYLRIWAALASICFCIQFFIADLTINLLGQFGLGMYGMYKLYQELQE